MRTAFSRTLVPLEPLMPNVRHRCPHMRFIYGPIPSSQTFDPKEEGWTPLGGTDGDASRFAVIASLLSVPFIVPAVWVLLSSRSEIRGFLLGNPLYFVAFLILLVALIPVHEFIHALAYLKGLRSPRLMMGAWIHNNGWTTYWTTEYDPNA